MKALVKAKPEEGIWMEDVPEPQIGPDDVLIKIKRTAICGTDIHIYNWDDWAAKNVPTPMIVGHEYAGEIVDIGGNVTRVKKGQRVSGEGHVVGDASRADVTATGRHLASPQLRHRQWTRNSVCSWSSGMRLCTLRLTGV